MNKIVIVGGGSAGWMTAATLIKEYPNRNITLIESPNAPVIGVGESTLGQINNWLAYLGIKDEEFMKATDASYKLSIRFQDFYKKDYGAFHYPFGNPDIRGTKSGLNDWLYKKFLDPDLNNTDYADTWSTNMLLVNANKYTDNKDNILPEFNSQQDVAYHFDAIKFGQFLKSNYCLNKGVKYIVGDVTDTKVTEKGIEEIVINNSQSISADLFIDCTGFKSLLLGGALKEPFNSYEDILPNNSAVATQIPYRNKKKELVPYTNCIAQDNGWIWQIPLWSRIGSGYVYSDKYISDEQAIVDFKEFLNKHKYPIKDCKFKTIKMKVGLHRRTFVKNVCAIGLSAGFIEPLESNGLYTVHVFLMNLLRTLQRGEINRFDKDAYNYHTSIEFRNFAEFVAMHYSLSHRTDTKYWKDIQEREFCKDLVDPQVSTYNGFVRAVYNKYHHFSFEAKGGLHYLAAGMNWFPTDVNMVTSETLQDVEFQRLGWNMLIKKLEERKQFKEKIIKKLTPFYDYLKDKFYG
tara:strand:+ start:1512 stop:3065 length:1554 start_codon:yes stop_codon:yes gene_type:complete